MIQSDQVSVGQVVRSLAGRDKGMVFVVIGVLNEKEVLIADGRHRKLEHPKKKKLKHLALSNTVIQDVKNSFERGEELSNRFLWKLLKPFRKEYWNRGF